MDATEKNNEAVDATAAMLASYVRTRICPCSSGLSLDSDSDDDDKLTFLEDKESHNSKKTRRKEL